MKLAFETLSLEGFRSFVEPTVLKLSTLEAGLHFIRGVNKFQPRLGSNGAGKSSLWDALCWCLYGKTAAGLKNTDVVSWAAELKKPERTRVALTLAIDGKRHKIVRTVSPNTLTWDGDTTGTDAIIERTGLSFEVFTNTVLFGQGQPLFLDLAPKAAMDLFVDVLDLTRWDERSVKAKVEADQLQSNMTGVDAEIAAKAAIIVQTKRLLGELEKDSQEWSDAHQRAVAAAKDRVAELLVLHERAKLRHDEVAIQADAAGAETVHHQREINKIVEALDKLRTVISAKQSEASRVLGSLRELEHQLKQFGDGDECPICGQPAKNTKFGKHKKEIQARVQELKKELKTYDTASLKLDDDELIKNRELNRAHLRQFGEEARIAEGELHVLGPRVQELAAQLSVAEKLANEKGEVVNPYRTQLHSQRQLLGKLEEDQEELRQVLADLDADHVRTKTWVKGFKDIRLMIVDEVLQQLELTANAGLEEMGMAGWRIEFAVERETKAGTVQRGLTVLITEPGKAQARWGAWSGGEGQRLRLVAALALSEVLLSYAGVDIDLEILDEPTRHLSDQGVYDLCEYLADRAKTLGRATVYVDHQSVESTLFESVLTVVKDKQGTHIQ